MWSLGTPAVQIVARATLVYLFTLLGLRLSGKREVGQLTIVDLVVLLLLANAVQNAMVGPDTSLIGGLLAAGVLLGLDALVARLRLRSSRLRRALEGTPTLLVYQGQVLHNNLRHEQLDGDDLEVALRQHGLHSLAQVKLAVLETNGTISVVPYP